MRPIVREHLFKAVARVIFHSGALKLLKGVANRFKLKKNDDGELQFPFLAKRANQNVQILIYHRVNDDLSPFFSGISNAVFRYEMEYPTSICALFSLDLKALLQEAGYICAVNRIPGPTRVVKIPSN